ncbi:MAG: hypothetical protein E7546_06060 [Ruminococcaceae bacterium]|nr:hypothetical protein [Oscillospiraceae bacterium]
MAVEKKAFVKVLDVDKLKNINRKNMIIYISLIAVIIVFLVIAVFLQSSNEGNRDNVISDSILISEVLAQNNAGITDDDGDYSDWIEVRNNGNKAVSMKGWYLSDDRENPYKWEFPPITVYPGEYIVVFASGKNRIDSSVSVYHTNFKLNNEGEEVVLTCLENKYTQIVAFEEAQPDISYALSETDDGSAQYLWFEKPTPFAENIGTSASEISKLPSPVSGVVINEYMTDNTLVLYDYQGDYSDWVELYNSTDSDIDITACSLSDTRDNLQKWLFPSGTVIPAKGYLLVHLSGKDCVENNEIHAGFGLNIEDKELIICDSATRIIDSVQLVDLQENVSAGRNINGEWVFFTNSSPGKENHNNYFSELSTVRPLEGSLMISEVCAATVNSNTGIVGTDWIEIYNGTQAAVNLNGYTLSNQIENLSMFVFKDTTIGVGEYLVVYAAGDDSDPQKTVFNIDCSGEDVFLGDPSGKVIDSFSTGKLRIGVTSGRRCDGTADRVFFTTPTKGKANAQGYTGYAPKPEILTEGGYAENGSNVVVEVPEGFVVRYTVDGSEPTEASQQYTGPIVIDHTFSFKAAAFADGFVPSDSAHATYIVENRHSIPMLCVSGDPDGLFSEQRGIFCSINLGGYKPYFQSNYWQDWEREVVVEYYDDDGLQVEFKAGAKITGYYSRMLDKKSFALHVRGAYGAKSVTYPFFGEDEATTAKAFQVRGGGQGQVLAMMRDELCAEVAQRNSDTFLVADWQPVALYLNGRYWGLYYLREKINEDYLALNYGIDKEKVDIIYNRKTAIAGTMDEYKKLLRYMQTHNLNSPECWEYVCSQIDIDSAIDYSIFEAFFDNYDSKNIRCFKGENGKWNWIFFDLDAAFCSDGKSNIGHEYIARTDPLIRSLFKSKKFKSMYLERYVELLNTAFMPDNILSIVDEIEEMIEEEMKLNCERWGYPSYSKWQGNVSLLRDVISKRRGIVINWLRGEFDLSYQQCEELFI